MQIIVTSVTHVRDSLMGIQTHNKSINIYRQRELLNLKHLLQKNHKSPWRDV